MDSLIVDLYKNCKANNGGHICYLYNNEENYITNAVSFIVAGIKNGDNILLLENDRHIRQIKTRLEKELTTEELSYLQVINNFDFYYTHGNFHPQTVVDQFIKNTETQLQKRASISTWGLIEWREDQEICNSIAKYEQELHKHLDGKGIVSVCVYNADRVTDSFQQVLQDCHGIVMNEKEVIHVSQ
jgi:MEDS: MEthanogen/methylotroph, DcmR Sensory domain